MAPSGSPVSGWTCAAKPCRLRDALPGAELDRVLSGMGPPLGVPVDLAARVLDQQHRPVPVREPGREVREHGLLQADVAHHVKMRFRAPPRDHLPDRRRADVAIPLGRGGPSRAFQAGEGFGERAQAGRPATELEARETKRTAMRTPLREKAGSGPPDEERILVISFQKPPPVEAHSSPLIISRISRDLEGPLGAAGHRSAAATRRRTGSLRRLPWRRHPASPRCRPRW